MKVGQQEKRWELCREREIKGMDKEAAKLCSFEGVDNKTTETMRRTSLLSSKNSLKRATTIYVKPILQSQKRYDEITGVTKKSKIQSSQGSKDYPNKLYLSLTAEVAVESDYDDTAFFPSLSPC